MGWGIAMGNRRGHCQRLLPALAFVALHQEAASLVLPKQIGPSGKHSSIRPQELQCSHKWRRRRAFDLTPPVILYDQCDIVVSSQSGGASRKSTSLFMTKSSESTGGFGKNDDKKKKGGDGNARGGPNPKANKSSTNKGNAGKSSGVSKGASSSSGNGDQIKASDRPGNKTKRNPRRKNNKAHDNTKRQKKHIKGKTKPKTQSNPASTVGANNSSIQRSDENTSLKGFKSDSPPEIPQTEKPPTDAAGGMAGNDKSNDSDLQKRIVQLESIVSNQVTEIQKLRREIDELTKSSKEFANVVDVLREAGLRIDEDEEIVVMSEDEEIEGDDVQKRPLQQQTIYDDMEIFGMAPKSVTDAADAAGASILSAILAGKHRMLVDVRDAELTRDPKLFVEFVELAILPVAAGLEGLDGDEYVRNRVKIVFPTVKELMSYRRSMALAAPEVVSLSTLGFDPVDERDNLIVVIAPSPDDIAGVHAMEKLMARTEQNYVEPDLRITQPVVVLNHHMVPIDMSDFGKFTSVYHLRLLSVQYMTGDSMPEYVAKDKSGAAAKDGSEGAKEAASAMTNSTKSEEEDALEAAMTHAHEIGVHQGVTRAMVIRAYPKPWHVFVDTSPDTDADFEVAATFDMEPTQEDVNYAIVECLEGSEREDEIVAQQMQAALESGQLNRVSDMLGISPSDIVSEDKASSLEKEEDDDDKPFKEYDGNDWDDLFYDDWFSEDSV